jgi:farnesyl-diphosphate farnesyltransferase
MDNSTLQRFQIDLNRNQCGDPWGYSFYMLGQVSRTFALNINVLAKQPRRSIMLAYLFMRMADTVEDDPQLAASAKQHLLQLFSNAFANSNDWLPSIRTFQSQLPESWKNSEDPNHFLCVHAEWSLALLFQFKSTVVGPICASVREMCAGMAEFALRQEERREGWLTLNSVADLDRYCYYVAGLVGNMLCDLFRAHSFWISAKRYRSMRNYSVSFGLGLQITNIIKDIAEDSTRNVCFIPEELCRQHGIATSPELFQRPAGDPARLAVIQALVQKAWDHLSDAIHYTLLLPLTEPRLRLFCLWPLFMAAETLGAIKSGESVFDPNAKVKISRSDVKRIVHDTTLHFGSKDWIWQRFHELRQTKELP